MSISNIFSSSSFSLHSDVTNQDSEIPAGVQSLEVLNENNSSANNASEEQNSSLNNDHQNNDQNAMNEQFSSSSSSSSCSSSATTDEICIDTQYNDFLLHSGPIEDVEDSLFKKGTSLLILLYKENRKDLAESLIKTNAKRIAEVLLISACADGCLDLVEFLLDAKVEINCGDIYWSPLNKACFGGHEKIVKLLIERKANLTSGAFPPFLYAVRHFNMAKMFVEGGLDLNHKFKGFGSNYLIYACREKAWDVAKLLLENEAKTDFEDIKYPEDDPLIETCKHGHKNTIKLLLKKGANVNACPFKGNPLSMVCLNGNLDLAKLLVKKGAIIQNNQSYLSPVFFAHALGHLDVMKYLVEAAWSYQKNNLLNYAFRSQNFLFLDLLLNKGQSPDLNKTLIEAASLGDVPVLDFCLGKKDAIFWRNQSSTNLKCSNWLEWVNVVKAWFQKSGMEFPQEKPPLHFDESTTSSSSSSSSDQSVMESPKSTPLLTFEPRIPADMFITRYLLEVCRKPINKSAVALLMEQIKSTSIDLENEEGMSLLSIASSKGHLNAVHFLISNGASLEKKDSQGKTALVHASEAERNNVVEYLSVAMEESQKPKN